MATTVVMEYVYDEPMDDARLEAMLAKLKTCFEVSEIKWVHCYLSIDRRTQIAVFEAIDAHTVQQTHRMLDVPFARSWALGSDLLAH